MRPTSIPERLPAPTGGLASSGSQPSGNPTVSPLIPPSKTLVSPAKIEHITSQKNTGCTHEKSGASQKILVSPAYTPPVSAKLPPCPEKISPFRILRSSAPRRDSHLHQDPVAASHAPPGQNSRRPGAWLSPSKSL